MVGVPGRSKGCATCRARHIRCDETRPSCNRCKRAGYECQGYDRVTIFVDETDWVQSKHGVNRLISDAANDSPSQRSTSSAGYHPKRSQTSQAISEAFLNSSLQQAASELANNPSRQVSSDVLGFVEGVLTEGQFRSTAWSYATSADVEDTDMGCGSGSEFDTFSNAVISSMKGGGSITNRPSLPRMIAQAAVLALYGRKCGDIAAVVQAARFYGYVVRQVGADLRKPNLASNQIILTSILNLGFYDWIASTSMSAWRHHTRALGHLMEMKGPSALGKEIDVKTFMQARSMLVVLGLEDARRSFLEQENWMTIPWLERRAEKSLMHMFVDVLCHLPGMLHDMDVVRGLPDEAPQKASLQESIRNRIPQLSRYLFEIRWKWELANPGCCIEFNAKDLFEELISADENGKPLFGPSYFFNDMARAVELNFYNIAYLLLLEFAMEVGCIDEMMATNPMDLRNSNPSSLNPSDVTNMADRNAELTTNLAIPILSQSASKSQLSFSATPIPPNLLIETLQSQSSTALICSSPFSKPKTNPCLPWPHEQQHPHVIAYEICRSVDYSLLSQHRTTGAYFIIFPIRTLQYIFGKQGWEAEWLRKVMKVIGDQGFQGVYEYC